MPLKLDFKRIYSCLSDRVKCTDIHSTEPWILVALYNGQINIHNTETQKIIKSFDVGQIPVRACAFVCRKNWIVCGADDLVIRVYNYNTLEKIHSFEAHVDYIRCICAHQTKPYLITCGDDMLIKVWDWDNRWRCIQTMEGHYHYVMRVAINPKDNNQLCSASLDKCIKVWQLGSGSKANYTLEGHDKGVNSVDYCYSGDKPYIISGSDDWNIKIWDYQNKSCVHTLTGHTNNVIRAIFHPNLPIIISASEDGNARIWNISTFRCESTLNYGMGRMWSISAKKDSNEIIFGYDDGVLALRAGKEGPMVCMDSSGKVFYVKQNHIFQANIKNLDAHIRDEEKIVFSFKELGTSEIYPQLIISSPNGRFVTIVGDGEFVVYTTIVLRSKIFGSGDLFAWCNDSNSFASREGCHIVLYKNFKEAKKINAGFTVEDLFGGTLLGVRSTSDIFFYEWSDLCLIIKIDVLATKVYWNSEGTFCCLCDTNSLHILKYKTEIVESYLKSDDVSDYGVPEAFEPISTQSENVVSGCWISESFMFTNKSNRLCYIIGDQVFTMKHIDKKYFIIGHAHFNNRLFLADNENNVISYKIETKLIEYEIAIIKKEHQLANELLPSIPCNLLGHLALFLENQDLLDLALELTSDLDHKFDLALRLNKLNLAQEIAENLDNTNKWIELGRKSSALCRFDISLECYRKIKDVPALLFLSYVLNSSEILDETLQYAIAQNNINVAFLIYYVTGRVNDAINLLKTSDMEAEAAIMAYSYAPELLENTFDHWQENLGKINPKYAQKLAHPIKYPNLFPHQYSSNLVQEIMDINLNDVQ